MKRIRVVAMFFVAALALVAVASASASAAEPALYECAKAEKVEGKYTGEYTDNKCSEKATAAEIEEGKTNKYEVEEGVRKDKAFRGSGKGGEVEIAGLGLGYGGFSCSSETVTGKATSPTTLGRVVITFKGCESCGNTETAGEIVTEPLVGEFGYLSGKGGKTPSVGIDLKPESGEVLYAYYCGGLSLAVTGSVIGEVTPVNEFTKTTTFTFKQSSKVGEQELSHFEGGPEDTLLDHVCDWACPDPVKEANSTVDIAFEGIFVNKGEELMLKA